MRTKNGVKTIRVPSSEYETVEVYENVIEKYADDYKKKMEKKGVDVYDRKNRSFVGMLQHINRYFFKHHPIDLDDIYTLDTTFDIYVSLCSEYNRTPNLKGFSFMTGIESDSFYNWLNGLYRGGEVGDGSSPSHLGIVKRWKSICEMALIDDVSNTSSVGGIFLLKSTYGYTETAPAQIGYQTDTTRNAIDIANAHRLGIERKESNIVHEIDLE